MGSAGGTFFFVRAHLLLLFCLLCVCLFPVWHLSFILFLFNADTCDSFRLMGRHTQKPILIHPWLSLLWVDSWRCSSSSGTCLSSTWISFLLPSAGSHSDLCSCFSFLWFEIAFTSFFLANCCCSCYRIFTAAWPTVCREWGREEHANYWCIVSLLDVCECVRGTFLHASYLSLPRPLLRDLSFSCVSFAFWGRCVQHIRAIKYLITWKEGSMQCRWSCITKGTTGFSFTAGRRKRSSNQKRVTYHYHYSLMHFASILSLLIADMLPREWIDPVFGWTSDKVAHAY